MTLDAQGYIRTVAGAVLQDSFKDAINDICRALLADFEQLIHSIYLYGSVAEGKAVPFISDLDISIVLRRRASPIEQLNLNELRASLEQQHVIVSKIDFDLGTLEDVLSPEGKLSWGYWLKHHCQCIYGEDLSIKFEKFKPCRNIAMAVNGDFYEVLSDYLTRIISTTSTVQVYRLQREAARKLIRSTNILRRHNDNDWPAALEEYASKFALRYPTKVAEIDYFLCVAKTESDDDSGKNNSGDNDFAERLQSFNEWMKNELKFFD